MSKTIAKTLSGAVRAATVWMKPERARMARALVAENLTQRMDVETAGGTLHFHMPSARSLYEPAHLFDNEPETIRWIDSIPAGETLWDIGANIGVYSLYAAKVRNLNVLAFEPSASSYAVLTKNIEINGLGEAISAYCIAFDERTHLNSLNMAHTEAGHSMHAFGRDESIEGAIDIVFRQAVPGFSIDQFIETFSPPLPDHIKLDVDSIEVSILRGGERTLRRHTRTVMVEIDGSALTTDGRDIREILGAYGFSEDVSYREGARRNVLFTK